MNIICNGKRMLMKYEDICESLGFNPNTNFVKVTNRGTTTFTVGKIYEIRSLYKSVIDNGYKPAKSFTEIYRKHVQIY